MTPAPAKRPIPGAVWLLGAVSLLNDLASDMIYPVLPLFLASVLGAGPVVLGAMEGLAEAASSLLKVYSGARSDKMGRRVPLVIAGYACSNLVRPLIGLATAWPQVLALRFADRVGKGLRTSPRDALIADVTTPEQRGISYGLHRAMDHAGAVAGPLLTALLLSGLGWSLRSIFLLTAVPAALVLVALLLGLREPPRAETAAPPVRMREGWQQLGGAYRRLLFAVGLFTLGGSTDAFLLLRLSDAGISAAGVSVLWAGHHGIKMVSTYGGGALTDRIGPRPVLTLGWALYAASYLAFALVDSPAWLIAVFLLYGLYYGLTEAAQRTWVSFLVPAHLRGSAFGWFHGVEGLAALPASLGFGLLLHYFGVPAAFLSGAALAGAACLLLLTVPRATP
jgi:MFS family permease